MGRVHISANELGCILLGGGELWLCGLGSDDHPWTDPVWLAWWQSHTADLALFTAELFFFSPNKILPETIQCARGIPDRGDRRCRGAPCPPCLPSPSLGEPRTNLQSQFKNQHVFSLPTQALPPTRLLLPQHIPPESQGALLPLQGLRVSWVLGGGA